MSKNIDEAIRMCDMKASYNVWKSQGAGKRYLAKMKMNRFEV